MHLVVAYSERYEGQLPVWLTQESGIFKKHGLDVDLQYIASSNAIAALVSGQTQISQGGGSEAVSAVAGGEDLVIIGNLIPVYPYVFEVVPSIKAVSDLRGKKIGVSQPGSESDIATRAALEKVGLQPDRDVTIVPVGSSQNRTAALERGAIDGGLDQPPYSILLERQGLHPLFDLASLKLPTVNNGIIVRRSYLRTHRDVLQRYVDALVEGIALMKKNETLSISVLEKYLKLNDRAALQATYRFATRELFPSLPTIDTEQLQDIVTVLAAKNPRVGRLRPSSVIDDSLVENAGRTRSARG
ncbi:MAG TPA: NrtA/SsuA/CpmA family ABC transporter substrate-binding protein [Candidatus Dormibacteraeota bacterium]|nr:NrtA/SsuA/CpmA family ABC transporter substrate-binding protein [Candidatus Dormibacteraeota bacterium]